MAKAMASLASMSMPKSDEVAILTSGRNAAR